MLFCMYLFTHGTYMHDISNILDLMEVSFCQNHYIENTAICNTFTIDTYFKQRIYFLANLAPSRSPAIFFVPIFLIINNFYWIFRGKQSRIRLHQGYRKWIQIIQLIGFLFLVIRLHFLTIKSSCYHLRCWYRGSESVNLLPVVLNLVIIIT